MSKVNKVLIAIGAVGLIVLISLLVVLHFKATPTWKENYDLGVRYLSEGNYQEAVFAFTAAIEIDPRQADAYVGRGDAYTMVARELSHGIADPDQLGSVILDSYKNAIRDYKSAIERGKKDAKIYQKIAEDYMEMGDPASAAEILEQGFEATQDEELRQVLDELPDISDEGGTQFGSEQESQNAQSDALQQMQDEQSGVVTAGEILPTSEEYAALEQFLSRVSLTEIEPDYDATNVLSINYYGEKVTFLDLFLSAHFCHSYDESIYPIEIREKNSYYEGDRDPLSRMVDFDKVNSDGVDWLLENIFNCNPSDIAQMEELARAKNDKYLYYLDGYYYYEPGPGGASGVARITNIEQSGLRYNVVYNKEWLRIDPDEEIIITPYRAQVALKEIDGKTYWTLYSNQNLGQSLNENLTYSYQVGKLTIKGTGAMTNFGPFYPLLEYTGGPIPPWATWADGGIISAILEDGVTNIGSYAFLGCSEMRDISIPKSVTSIDTSAFIGCTNLSDVYYAGEPDELPGGLPDSIIIHYNSTGPTT